MLLSRCVVAPRDGESNEEKDEEEAERENSSLLNTQYCILQSKSSVLTSEYYLYKD